MVVYIDILLVVNLIINYLLISLTVKLSREKIKRHRLLLSASFGAVYSLVLLIGPLNVIVSNILKLFVSAVMVFIAFGRIKIKTFIKRLLLFYIIGSVFAGLMFALYFFVTPAGMSVSNGIVYFNVSAPLLIILIGGIYLALSLFQRIFMRLSPDSKLYKLRIYYNGKSALLWGLYDTGNSLKDSFYQIPAVVCSYKSVKELVPDNEFFKGDIGKIMPPFRVMPYNVVGGRGLLPAFVPERAEIWKENRWEETQRIIIAVSGEMPPEYDCILPSEIF
jgi:stage II sporulation protein GA (sporulation sigma-E factor processing peptidase)